MQTWIGNINEVAAVRQNLHCFVHSELLASLFKATDGFLGLMELRTTRRPTHKHKFTIMKPKPQILKVQALSQNEAAVRLNACLPEEARPISFGSLRKAQTPVLMSSQSTAHSRNPKASQSHIYNPKLHRVAFKVEKSLHDVRETQHNKVCANNGFRV